MTQRQRRHQRRRGGTGAKLVLLTCSVIGMMAVGMAVAGGWVLSIASEAPDPDTVKPLTHGRNSVVYAGDGSRLGYIRSDQLREPVRFKDMPQVMRDAVISIEDQRFHEHSGVDMEGGMRALVENITAQEIREGGSTITMQLMRNLFIADPKRNIDRKIREAAMALDYEQSHTKQEIITQYLNTASFGTLNGSTAVGVQAASRMYFSRPAKKLTVPQAALLAGLPQAPTDYNPVLNPALAKERRNEVLAKMVDQGVISEKRGLAAQSKGLQLNPTSAYTKIREPLFFDYVESDLIARYGVNTVRQGGLDVFTTIDPAMQDAGRAAIEDYLYLEDDPSSAIVAIDPASGEIKTMVSSSQYSENKYNLAAQGRRQPGSTFKTFALATAVKQGINPDSTYYVSKPLNLDLPEWGEWEVTTYGNSYSGSMSLTQATLASDNTVYAQLALDVGPEEVARTAKEMGITTELDGFPAEALGGLRIGVSPVEMASAYATIASGGIYRPPVAIKRVEFPSGRVDHPQSDDPRRVLSEEEASVITDILNQNMTGGTGTAAYAGCSGQAGKTGTTDNFTDAWFIGFQPNMAISVWVGYPESNAIEMTSVHGESVAGGTFPARIWNSFYNTAGIDCVSPQFAGEPDWSDFSSGFTTSPHDEDEEGEEGSEEEDFSDGDDEASDAEGTDGEVSGEFDPDAYAPGVGQEPTQAPTENPAPTPAPSPAPTPTPQPPANPAPGGNPGGNGGPSTDGGFSPTG